MRSFMLLLASSALVVFQVAEARTLLGTKYGKCTRELITVQTTTGMADVKKGQSRQIQIPSKRFWWYCGKKQEWTTCPDETTVLNVTRTAKGPSIGWACYRE